MRAGAARPLLAAVEHALDLATWESLVRRRGLEPDDAVELLVRFVVAV